MRQVRAKTAPATNGETPASRTLNNRKGATKPSKNPRTADETQVTGKISAKKSS